MFNFSCCGSRKENFDPSSSSIRPFSPTFEQRVPLTQLIKQDSSPLPRNVTVLREGDILAYAKDRATRAYLPAFLTEEKLQKEDGRYRNIAFLNQAVLIVEEHFPGIIEEVDETLWLALEDYPRGIWKPLRHNSFCSLLKVDQSIAITQDRNVLSALLRQVREIHHLSIYLLGYDGPSTPFLKGLLQGRQVSHPLTYYEKMMATGDKVVIAAVGFTAMGEPAILCETICSSPSLL